MKKTKRKITNEEYINHKEKISFKEKYSYLHKDILNIYNIDVKQFNQLIKNIKDNKEYHWYNGYSEKTIDYINNILNQ